MGNKYIFHEIKSASHLIYFLSVKLKQYTHSWAALCLTFELSAPQYFQSARANNSLLF